MTKEVLIPAVGLAVILFLIIRFHVPIILFLVKLYYGKYNPRYVKVHKNFTGKSPYAYCIKDDFINHISGYYDKLNPIEIFKSNSEIEFGSLPFASKYRKLLRLKGKPFCVNLNGNNFFDLKVLGYRDELIGIRIRANFVFIDKRFVMGEYSLKTPDKAGIEELSSVLQKKYLGTQKTDGENFIIEGANKVSVLFENTGFNLSIKYLYQGNEDMNLMLDDFWKKSIYVVSDPVVDIESDLMDKL